MNKIFFFFILYGSLLCAEEKSVDAGSPSPSPSPITPVVSEPITPLVAPLIPTTQPLERPKKSIQTSKIIKTSEEDDGPASPESNLQYTQKIQNELEEIKNLSADRYLQEIDHYRVDIDKYIEHKKRVCNGEFTTNVLGDEKADAKNNLKRKLNTAEKKLCFREMKAFQVTMINNVFIARKRFLEYMHEERMKELSLARDKIIEELQSTFAR